MTRDWNRGLRIELPGEKRFDKHFFPDTSSELYNKRFPAVLATLRTGPGLFFVMVFFTCLQTITCNPFTSHVHVV